MKLATGHACKGVLDNETVSWQAPPIIGRSARVILQRMPGVHEAGLI